MNNEAFDGLYKVHATVPSVFLLQCHRVPYTFVVFGQTLLRFSGRRPT